MAKSKKNADKGTYTLEENLALTNEELTSNWSKLASLIRTAENIKWEDARTKAVNLMKDKSDAFEYIESIRSGSTSKTDTKTTKINQAKEPKQSPKVVKHPATQKRDQFSMNYRRLLKVAPDLEERLLNNEEVYGKSKKTGYMDFNLELLHRDQTGFYLAISHYFKQNGDMVADPDMVIRFDPDMQIIEALSYQDQFGYIEVYDNIYNRKMVRFKEKSAQNSFLSKWLTNLRKQEHLIEWRHIESPEPPKGRKGRSDSKSNTYEKPDITFMDSSVISGVKEYISSLMLDTVIKLYTKHRDNEQPMRPIAQFFAVDRILHSPILNPDVSYPTEKELKIDYEKLRDFQTREKQVDESVPTSIDNQESESMEQQKEEIEKTIKYWTKLAAVIQEYEGASMTPEKAKEKALELKKEGKAEEYVIKAFVNQRKNGVDKILKNNFSSLSKLLPDYETKLESESAHAFIILNKNEGYKIHKAASINKSTAQYVLYEETDKGNATLLFAVQKVRKRAWVTLMTGNFFHQSMGIEDYMDETFSKSAPERYEVNKLFNDWLNQMNREKSDVAWGDTNTPKPVEQKIERTDVEKKLEELKAKYPIVLEWTEGTGGNLRGFKTVEALQKALLENGFTESPNETYIKNKIWFDGYPSYIRIDVSKSKGDYDPTSEELLSWLTQWESKEFDWSVFSKQLKKKETPKKEVKNETEPEQSEVIIEFDLPKAKKDASTIPVFEVGKVEYTEQHKRAGIKKKDINWINKHRQGMILTPRKNPINNTKSLEKDLGHQAKRPGKRISATGRIYYEGRSNRSDLTDSGL